MNDTPNEAAQVNAEILELLKDMVAASDANDGGALLNCIEAAREMLDALSEADRIVINPSEQD